MGLVPGGTRIGPVRQRRPTARTRAAGPDRAPDAATLRVPRWCRPSAQTASPQRSGRLPPRRARHSPSLRLGSARREARHRPHVDVDGRTARMCAGRQMSASGACESSRARRAPRAERPPGAAQVTRSHQDRARSVPVVPLRRRPARGQGSARPIGAETGRRAGWRESTAVQRWTGRETRPCAPAAVSSPAPTMPAEHRRQRQFSGRRRPACLGAWQAALRQRPQPPLPRHPSRVRAHNASVVADAPKVPSHSRGRAHGPGSWPSAVHRQVCGSSPRAEGEDVWLGPSEPDG